MTVITTSTLLNATATPNQRKIDRCQNGVLWEIYQWQDAGTLNRFYGAVYSTNGGTTWTIATTDINGGGGNQYQPSSSLFIDLDDYAHLVYKSTSDGYLYYRRGLRNVGRTAYTWSAPIKITGGTSTAFDYPDVVAHREGTGWRVHIVWGITSTFNNAYYCRIDIESGGSITVGAAAQTIGAGYNNGSSYNNYPSIDFNHIGDGKTVANSTPNLYVAWSAGATGTGKGIRFRKCDHNAGFWTWTDEREIDVGGFVLADHWLNCMFDGTRVIIAGYLYSGSSSYLVIYDRDAADTTTTKTGRTFIGASSPGVNGLYHGASTYDTNGNVYLWGAVQGASPKNLSQRKWTRSTNTLGSITTIDSTVSSPHVSAKRGQSNSRIEFIYTDGTASPYSVTYGSIILNATPNVPTGLTVTSDSLDTTPVFSANVSDPDSTQPIKARFTIYQNDDTTVVGTVDSTLTAGAHTAVKEYASVLPVGNYKVAAATVDDANAVSAQTAQVSFAVKQAVEEDLGLLWKVDELITVNLQAQWDVLVSNQKDFSFSWNVTEQTEISLELEWSVNPAWIEVDPDPESPVIWEEVRV